MEKQSEGEVDEDGNVRYLFTHASDYVIVIDEAADVVADTEDSVDSTEVVENTENVEAEEPAEESGSVLPIIVIVCIVLFVVGAVILKKKRAA